MEAVLPNTESTTEILGIDFGWGLDSYEFPYGTLDLARKDFLTAYSTGHVDGSLSFAEAISPFTNHELANQNHDLASSTIDPTNTRLGSDLSTTSITTSRRDSAHASSATPSDAQTGTPETSLERAGFLQSERKSTQRARHAADQRHSKARNLQHASHRIGDASKANTQADGKKQHLREKNKVAAAKCRQRQQKQAENVREKVRGLSKTNAQLKSYVQELRQELNGLRVCALSHAGCDYKLARYNQGQAERLVAEYYLSFGSHSGTVMARDQGESQVKWPSLVGE